MKYRTSNVVVGGGFPDGLGRGRMATKEQPTVSTYNHASVSSVAGDRTPSEVLRDAFALAARQVFLAIPPAERTASETQRLKDSYRPERRVDIDEDAVSWLLDLQRRKPETRHALSDAIRAAEVQLAPAAEGCPIEAIMAEQDQDAVFDALKLNAIRTKSPSWIAQTRDAALALIHRLMVVVDTCNHFLARRAA